MKTYTFTIDGKSVEAKNSFEVINPATGEAFAKVGQASVDDLNNAVAAAKRAFPAWAATPDKERVAAINKLADLLKEHHKELSELITREQGKTQSGPGANVELEGSIGWTQATGALHNEVEEIINNDDELVQLHRFPVGVVGSITPWNWPLMIAIWHIIPALRVGCTIVIKPSSFTPVATLRFVELANQVLPSGVLNSVTGDSEIGEAISTHPDIAKIVFTGSTETGRRIMEKAGKTLKRLTLELGGNDAGIILPGTDMENRLEDLFWGVFLNAGQTCAAMKRLYVHEGDYDKLCEQFAAFVKQIKVGDGMNEENLIGPLSNEAQYKKVIELVEDAKAKGATMLTGGEPMEGKGYFYPLTLIANATHDMRVVSEEQFGPVIPIIKYKDVEEAIRMANSVEVGLGSSVWGNDADEARKTALRMEAGTMWVNRHAHIAPNVPMGGVKQSGIGVEFSEEGLREYTQVQVLSEKKINA